MKIRKANHRVIQLQNLFFQHDWPCRRISYFVPIPSESSNGIYCKTPLIKLWVQEILRVNHGIHDRSLGPLVRCVLSGFDTHVSPFTKIVGRSWKPSVILELIFYLLLFCCFHCKYICLLVVESYAAMYFWTESIFPSSFLKVYCCLLAKLVQWAVYF